MNEQIEQLVKQFAEDLMKRSGYDMRAFEPFLVESRLFAEKIVQECIGVIEAKMPEFTCKEDYDNLIRKAGRMDAIDEIREHFGVK